MKNAASSSGASAAVVLFRERSSDGRYAVALEKEAGRVGMNVSLHFCPVLTYRSVDTGVGRLCEIVKRDAAKTMEQGCFFIVTSPRSATILGDAIADVGDEYCPTVFVVGKATAAALESRCGVKGTSSASGSAAALAEFVCEHHRKQTVAVEYVFACGISRRNELPQTLCANNVPFEEIVVYESAPVDALSFDEAAASFACAVFFSPRGVHAVRDALIRNGKHISELCPAFAAIGKTTCNAIADCVVDKDACFAAATPTPHSVAEAAVAAMQKSVSFSKGLLEL